MNIGDKIPAILGVNQDGKEIKASDYAGKKLVLYFYPKDNTSGCSAEARSLRDHIDELKSKGYEVLGVSVDSQASHKRFIEKQQIPFDLISDTDHKLVEEMGVWGEKSMCGRKYMGTLRTTFLVDENGVITNIFTPKQIKTSEHAGQILEII